MNLIDNRYKMNRLSKDYLDSTVYEVSDFWDNDKKLYMKLYELGEQKKVIEYFIENFIILSKIKHKNLLQSEQFKIINTMDKKTINIKQYYCTSEYFNTPSLKEVSSNLNLEEKLGVILQVCTVLDFLHYRGVVYKHLSPSNIFISDSGNVKLMDLATIYEKVINLKYDDLTRYFIAPEIIADYEEAGNKSSDKYSLGVLMKYLFTENFRVENNNQLKDEYISELNEEQIDFLSTTILKLTKKDPQYREISLKNIIESIRKIFNIDYKVNLVKERGILNFDTKIVGREKELEKILELDHSFSEYKFHKKTILISGEKGVGKTRLLKEISHILKLRGRNVYYDEILEESQDDLQVMTNLLRQITKDTSKTILERYEKEFIKILPELDMGLDIKSYDGIVGNNEKLRLYDRITKYLEEVSRDNTIYLIIDNLSDNNIQLLDLLDYIMKNTNKGNIFLISSYNNKLLKEDSVGGKIIKNWIVEENIEDIRLSNLDLSEIGEFIQYILGISYRPLNFSAVMLKEGQGNPRHIEYMMKNLLATGELSFNPKGSWKIKAKKYSDIYFPTNIDEALNNQINLIKDEYMDIMKAISIHNISMSKAILLKFLSIDGDVLNENLDELMGMRLLNEKVDDWGYSYDIANVQLKSLIYHQIPEDEIIKLHKEIANLLERIYIDNHRVIMDELVYHLMLSDQPEKALDYILKEARTNNNMYTSQSILLWEEAYEITKHIDRKYEFEILKNLGKGYIALGENNKALKFYNKILEKSIKFKKDKYTIEANLGIGEVYFTTSSSSKALQQVSKALELSKQIEYTKGIIKSKILYFKIILHEGDFEYIGKSLMELLEFSIENEEEQELGDIYNILGLNQYFEGKMKEAVESFEKSILYFNKSNKFIDSAKPINNIGNIYMQHYGNKQKAMEYYEKGLKVVVNYGQLKTEATFLNNIGEIYISLCEYSKATDYIEKAMTLSTKLENIDMVFLTNINLGRIYLLRGEYGQAYNSYIMVKRIYAKSSDYNLETISQYYSFLGQFYITFGKWDKAFKNFKSAIELCKEYSHKQYLEARSGIVVAEYFKNGTYNKKEIERIRYSFKDLKLNYDRRAMLLYLALISYLEKDYEYALDILKEDELLEEDSSALVYNYRHRILKYSMDTTNNYEPMMKLQEDMKEYDLFFVDVDLNYSLVKRLLKDKKYYKSANCLLETLDIMYKLVKNIPDRDLQINYIKVKGGDEIKDKLNEVIYRTSGNKLDVLYIDDLKEEDSIEKYFNYQSVLDLINDEELTRIAEKNYMPKEIKEIDSIESLISKLTRDYELNLKLILNYLAKETFASKGSILVYDDETNKHIPIVSLNDDISWSPNENLLVLASRYEKGILINYDIADNIIELYREFLPKGARALICNPIAVPEVKASYEDGERRIENNSIVQDNKGYIYLETSRIFNRFDENKHDIISKLTQLLYINIENYQLKILSNIDKLTGLYTRKHFENECNKTLEDTKTTGETFAVLMADIDRFKNINDTYGHRKGDEVLTQIGGIIMNSIRDTDIAARYGGEEFIIVLKDITESQAIVVGEKIRKNIEDAKISKIEDSITMSIGISMYPNHSQFKEELIEKADQALYEAKEKGRNKVMVWDACSADTLNRVDKLAGILSGNPIQDQRNIMAILNTINLIEKDISKEEKIFEFLGGIIETLDAESCSLIYLDKDQKLTKPYSRSRFSQEWIENHDMNELIIKRVIKTKQGEFLIDWDNIKEFEILINKPNWQSIIVIPLIFNKEVKGIIYVSVSINEKEFDYNNYNLSKVLSKAFVTI